MAEDWPSPNTISSVAADIISQPKCRDCLVHVGGLLRVRRHGWYTYFAQHVPCEALFSAPKGLKYTLYIATLIWPIERDISGKWLSANGNLN